MNQYILYLIGAFVVSMVCGFVCIPAIIDFCVDKKLYDMPNSRKIHKSDIPRLGGLCFLPSMFVSFAMTVIVFNNASIGKQITMSLWSCFFFVSLLLIYVVGFVDDLVGLGAKTKFIVQILAVSLMPAAGLYINNLYGLFGIYDLPYWIGSPLTVFVMVFIINAMNLIDGIDGLSGGLSLLALTGFLVCFVREQMWQYSILIAGLLGVIVAFLYFNVWGKAEKHKKIFMGDTGSLTLGFILAFLFVKFAMENPNVMPFRRDSLMLPYTLLIVPVFDVVRVILVRLYHRKPLFDADKNHIHHKLMRTGLNQHKALVVILCLALSYTVVNILLAKYCYFSIVIIVDIAVWIVFHTVVNIQIKKHGQKPFVLVDAA